MTTAPRHEINGRDVTPRVGSYVAPDGWNGRYGELIASDWSAADFRIVTHSISTTTRSGFLEVAVNVEVTGRTIQGSFSAPRVRVRIEWVGDGEESTFSRGWLYI